MTFPGRWWHQPEAKDAFWLSWVSLICTLIAAIGGLFGFGKTESTLILTFGLENVVDFTSSVVVLWRFYCPHGGDEATLKKLEKREERASVAISMVIGLLGIFVFAIGILDMLKRDKDTDLSLLFMISFVSIIVFGTLTIVKFKYANDLNSPSLYKDGICSLIGTCLSASLLFTTAIIDYAPNAWYIDPIVSLIIGVSATVYGFRVIFSMVQSGIPIFHPDWWITKEGKVDTEQELPDVEKNGSEDYEGGSAAVDEKEVI
mmetsp:Transcript_18958/g.39963  ORF Transcript_18958/g.39963 Transcript_18958/m.39963 type:complete len:260 (+) Transcript_18958:229-1008(+)|eukprot:CAMPEP_0183780308 /NCGR_PEP_ID=MMETSP0739-20130205/55981_1 /TAXON_ID=385413 /ORGANISM="Thalassiosira miniscula, Strain CCMP1093" /LENGTH=259 /DNA_ID=CAMNT_0026023219 /DNA_START=65 /DNA_END=844 /DNA_ORIENTATION=-